MLEDQRSQIGDFDLAVDHRILVAREAEKDERSALGAGLIMTFHRENFCRLMLKRVEAVLIARENLDRRHKRRHPHRHGEHLARAGIRAVAQKVPCSYGPDDHCRGQVGADDGMDEAIGKARVEDDRKPRTCGHELALGIDRIACRRLHPAIHGNDPGRRDERPDGDHAGREKMRAPAYLVDAEQHHAKETGFKEERGQNLIGHERADDRTGLGRKYRPVRPELVGHHHARDHTHAERDGEDLEPVAIEVRIHTAAGLQPQPFKHHEIACRADGEGREDEVE